MWQWFRWWEICLLKAGRIGEGSAVLGHRGRWWTLWPLPLCFVFIGWPTLVFRVQNCDCGPSSLWTLQVSVNASFSCTVVLLSFLLWDCVWGGGAEIIITLGLTYFSMLERLQFDLRPTFVLNKGCTHSLPTHYPCDYLSWIHHG